MSRPNGLSGHRPARQAPGRDRAPAHERDRPEDAVRRDDRRRGRPSRTSRDAQPCRTGSNGPSRRGGGSGSRRLAPGEVDQPVVARRSSSPAIAASPARASRSVHARPDGEVAVARGAVPGEVAPRELGERRVAVDRAPARRASRGRGRTPACAPSSGRGRRAPRRDASIRTWTSACPAVGTPAASRRSRSSSRVSGPSSASAALDRRPRRGRRRPRSRPPAPGGGGCRSAAAAWSAPAATGSPRRGRGAASRGSAR